MSMLTEATCAVFFACGLVLTIIVFESNQWDQLDASTVFWQASTKNGGLWEKCTSNANSGTEICAPYDNFFLGLPLHLQAARAFTISALVFGVIATGLATFAIFFCPCASMDDRVRNRVRLIGAASGGLGGLAILAGVSWYASTVMKSYYNTMVVSPDTERHALGTAIFIGWAAGTVSLLGSVVAACISCSLPDDDREMKSVPGRKVPYYPSKPVQEYV